MLRSQGRHHPGNLDSLVSASGGGSSLLRNTGGEQVIAEHASGGPRATLYVTGPELVPQESVLDAMKGSSVTVLRMSLESCRCRLGLVSAFVLHRIHVQTHGRIAFLMLRSWASALAPGPTRYSRRWTDISLGRSRPLGEQCWQGFRNFVWFAVLIHIIFPRSRCNICHSC